MCIGSISLTGDTVSGAVGIYPSKITGGVKSGTTYLSRTIMTTGYGQYSVLTGTTNYPLQDGSSEHDNSMYESFQNIVQGIISSTGSTIYLGNKFKFIGGTTSTRYCVLKYASIDNLPMHGLNNIDF